MASELDPRRDGAPEVLLRHAELVRGLARAILGDDAAADDVVQDTWVAALEHPPRTPRPAAWLASVARRFAWRRLRSDDRRRQRERAAARPESGDPRGPRGPRGDGAGRELLLENVTRAVLELREPYRSTLIQRYYEGRGPREIAERSGVPLATVASRLARATAEIRRQLDERTEGGRSAWALAAWSLAATQETLTMSTKWKVAASVAAVGLGVLGGRVAWEALTPDARPTAPDGVPAVMQAPAEERVAHPEAPAPPIEEERVAVATEPANPAGTEVEAVAAETGALVLHVVWDATGEPAPDHAFDFFPWTGLEPFAERFVRATDANGTLRLDGLTPGSLMFYGILCGGGRVEIEAGETLETELRLPEGMRLEIRVVDLAGDGLSEAQVWLSDESNDSEGRIVARTDATGHATLEGVGPSRTLAAFAAGHAPGAPQRIEGRPGETLEMVLQVGGQGARLAGKVLDDAGLPLPGSLGARVRVESPAREWRNAIAPWEAHCDETGRFVFEGLHAAPVEVSVRVPGFEPQMREVDLAEREGDGYVEFRLPRSGGVHGVVRTADGEPIAGAEIQHGQYGSFTGSYGRSRADGSFRLAHLPTGAVQLSVQDKTHGRADATLELAPGTSLEWNPVLTPGTVLEGRVVDEHGDPHTDFIVNAAGTRPDPDTFALWSEQTRTDSSGGFRFANCPDEKLGVEVRTAQYKLVRHLEDVRAEDGPFVFEVPADDLPSAKVTGTLLDHEGAPVPATVVLLDLGEYRNSHQIRAHPDTGAFEIGPVPPGRYLLRARPDSLPYANHGEVELEPRAELEIGAWWLEAPSRIAVEIEGGGPSPYERLTLYPTPEATTRTPMVRFEQTEFDDALVFPGTYVLRAEGPDVATEMRTIEVRESPTTTVHLTPTPGTPCRFVIGPELARTGEFLYFSLATAEGQLCAGWNEVRAEKEGREHTERLTPGTYTLSIRSWGDLRATRQIEVPDQESPFTALIDLD